MFRVENACNSPTGHRIAEHPREDGSGTSRCHAGRGRISSRSKSAASDRPERRPGIAEADGEKDRRRGVPGRVQPSPTEARATRCKSAPQRLETTYGPRCPTNNFVKTTFRPGHALVSVGHV